MLSDGSDDWGDARPGASIADDDDWNEVAAAPAAAAAAAPPLEHEAVSDDDWNEVAAAAAAAPPPPLDHDAVSDDAAPAELAAAPAQVLELRRQKLQDSIATTVANFFAAGAYQHTHTLAAEALGGSRRSVVRGIWVAAWITYHAARERTSRLVRAALATCRVMRGPAGEVVELRTPMVFIRKRKYDETQVPLVVDIADKAQAVDDEQLLDCFDRYAGKHRVVVLEGAFGMVLQKRTVAGTSFARVIGNVPCALMAVERNNGECLRKCFDEWRLDADADINCRFLRLVDVHMHDECSANLRAERAFTASHSDGSARRGSLEILCDAHKRAQVQGGMFKVVKPFDSRLILLSMSMKGLVKQHLRQAAREIIRERLTIIYASRPSVDADRHRDAVFSTFLSAGKPIDKYRKAILTSLFNGDLRKRDRIEHFERGCCSSPSQTRRMLCTAGVDCLFPRLCFTVLQRNNWTGSDVALDEIVLPTHIHGIFDAAYLRCAATVRGRQIGERPSTPLGSNPS